MSLLIHCFCKCDARITSPFMHSHNSLHDRQAWMFALPASSHPVRWVTSAGVWWWQWSVVATLSWPASPRCGPREGVGRPGLVWWWWWRRCLRQPSQPSSPHTGPSPWWTHSSSTTKPGKIITNKHEQIIPFRIWTLPMSSGCETRKVSTTPLYTK